VYSFLWNLSPAFTLVSCSAYSFTLKMEATCSSETCHLLSHCFLARLIPSPWRWRLHVPLKLVTCFHAGFCVPYSFTLKMEATCSSETCHLLSRWFLAYLILSPWRWRRHVPPHNHRCEEFCPVRLIAENVRLNPKHVSDTQQHWEVTKYPGINRTGSRKLDFEWTFVYVF
jgi:hypothetical protein